MSIQSDIQTLAPGTMVVLFEIDTTELGGIIYRFHNGVNELGNDVVWQGQTYVRFPIEADGFELRGSGTIPRPKIKVSNISGLLSALLRVNDDLVGSKMTRRRTLAQYLDAVNFPGGVNPTADPNAHFPDEVYFVDRKSAENRQTIEWELASALDVAGVTLPRRTFVANLCLSRYRKWDAVAGDFDYTDTSECGYTGTLYFDKDDQPCAAAQDLCAKRLKSCALRHGDTAPLPYGGFPNCGLTRIS